MVSIIAPPCLYCARFRRAISGITCDAYPDVIPDAIVATRIDHRQQLPGDHGLRFEQDPAMPLLDGKFYDAIFDDQTST
jgi:hypothetical protein